MVLNSSLKTLGIIPARFGSTRFPGKPLIPILGKSLVQHTFENSKRFSELQELIIATDDLRIAEHAASFGANVAMTSPKCLTGTDRLAEVVRSNPKLSEYDLILNIQGDEPCLCPSIVSAVIRKLQEDPIADMATAVIPLQSEKEALNPSVVKCTFDLNGNALYFSRSLIPFSWKKWEDSGPYYRHIGIYCFKREFLLKYAELPTTSLQLAEDLEQLKVLEHGFRIKVALLPPSSISIGVDLPEDIKKVEQLLCKLNTSLLPAE